MMNDDTLLLYHLNDGLTNAERAEVEAALATDEVLRARLARLAADLDTLRPVEAGLPDDMLLRLKASLERAAASAAAPAKPVRRRFGWGLGFGVFAAGTLALLIGLRVLHPPVTDEAPPTIATNAAGDDSARFERSVRWYLVDASQQLAGLGALPQPERDAVLDKVLAQNRLYVAAAERAEAPALARSLRALTPVMETLGALGDSAGDATALEGGIAQLGFEMKVIQARLVLRAPDSQRVPSRTMLL
jgi:hypothetical protein